MAKFYWSIFKNDFLLKCAQIEEEDYSFSVHMRGQKNKMLDEAKMRRLAMIQYMYAMAVDQSHKPEPLNMVGILLFHDAVELFLALASEYLDAGKTGKEFLAYWEPINQKLPNKDFGQKDSMNRLNA